MLHLIPTETERKKLFYWLEKSSSYTAWERIGGLYKLWVDAFQRLYEDTQRHPDPVHGVLLPDERIVSLLNGYACFEDALARLKTGNKRPFVWLGDTGYFSESGRVVDYWIEAIDKAESGDIEVKATYSGHWPQVKKTHAELIMAWSEVGIVEQERFTDVPAPVGRVEELSRCRFPTTELPDVPEPVATVLVRTGESVTVFGVWEPVKADRSGGFIGMFQKPKAPAGGTFDVDGCMNYLHQGSPAPSVFSENDGQRGEGRPAVWRLIWEDTRYVDGLIPVKERDYVFINTVAIAVPATPVATSSADPLIEASSGEIASMAGTWAVMDDVHGRIDVNTGDLLPLHNGRSVRWVWVNF